MTIRPILSSAALVLALAGCDMMSDLRPAPPPRTPAATVSAAPTVAAGSLQRPAGSQSVAQLDASAAEKAAATRPSAAGGRLGTTIASLGDATEGGFWIKTPLVSAPGKGRIVDAASGRSVNVDLIPLPGPASAGSQVSLPALTTLGADLTDLPELEVYRS
ncbi:MULTISPECIES: hypothetical protein [unclassified Paracoccus (in: a-proteobacteria)]|uniref:hypothetical protein n=1 Tax=unclassified Paracoccus (in: a-proteobacteria) TaxID=2688777 RepID=UPI001600D576|nr:MULTISPECIES: hypothetical protein [unclassified Paracoccus (in: a-proteobacteria)]MBB1492403.1 hypothetical protein [Paracoccus sp. MC1854]MBB1496768.1 hypothetical protein [Paracoccus sp. MC1862]QQO45404.1 hypothetical protein JGR78_03330 [Paracoccus sp. MC1862]